MLIDIPLNSGLITQIDDEEIGANGCTDLVNAVIDFPGKITKRKGRGAAVSIGANINNIIRWAKVAGGSTTYYWVITDTSGNIYITTDLGTLGSAVGTHTGNDVKIINYGNQLRFASGLSDYSKVYQYINRDYFWSAHTPYSGGEAVLLDNANVDPFGTNDGMEIIDSGKYGLDMKTDAGNSGILYGDNTYYYKVTKVMDGYQESSLPIKPTTNSRSLSTKGLTAGLFSTDSVANNEYFSFEIKVTEADFNNRITALNVYRAKNGITGPYYKVDTISTLGTTENSKLSDPNLVRVTDAKPLTAATGESGGLYYITLGGTVAGSTGGLSMTPPVNGDKIYTDDATPLYIAIITTDPVYDGYGYLCTATHQGATSGTAALSEQGYWGKGCRILNSGSGGSSSYAIGTVYGATLTYQNIFYSTNFKLGQNSHLGHMIMGDGNDMSVNAFENSNQNSMQSHIKNNLPFVIKIASTRAGWSPTTNAEFFINNSYVWKDYGSFHRCQWIDKGFSDGRTHFESSTNVKYKYSVNIEGRNYVANVKIADNQGNAEDHSDWVLFSQLGQPDVVPISNFIGISDLKGGQITGLGKLMGDLVVFHEKGIFRLSVPASDPATWSLVESEPNIGCIGTNSITEFGNGIFFAAIDHIYYLNSNFEAIPVTRTIRDTYQAVSNKEQTRMHVDPRKEQLLCRFGATSNNLYVLDLKKLGQAETWVKWDTSSQKKADLFVTDEHFTTHTIEQGGTSYMCEIDAPSENETTSFRRTTGWIKAGDLDDYKTIKRLNIRYNSSRTLKVEIYVDGDSSTAVNWQDGNAYHTIPADTSGQDWYKCKPAIRCKYFKIKISDTADTADIEINRLEVEYE